LQKNKPDILKTFWYKLEYNMKNKKLQVFLLILFFAAFYVLMLSALIYFETRAGNSQISTLFDAMWYSIVTLTTVGYGDLYPITTEGKIIGYIFVLGSLGILGLLISRITGMVAAIREDRKLGYKGTQFSDHTVIIGWNSLSRMVGDELYNAGKPFAVVTDKKEDIHFIYQRYSRKNAFVLFSDFYHFEILRKTSLQQANSVFINLSKDEDKLVYLLNLHQTFKNEKPHTPLPFHTLVFIDNPALEETFQSAGAHVVLLRHEITSGLVASYLFEPAVAEYSEDLLSSSAYNEDTDIKEYRVKSGNPFLEQDCEKTFFELKEKLNAVLIGIFKKKENSLIRNPAKDVLIEKGDYLILIVNGGDVGQIEKTFRTVEGVEKKDFSYSYMDSPKSGAAL
jgi:voltage-gated potassium channel